MSSKLRVCLLSKLLQKPDVALIKQLNIVDSIFQHRDSFYAHAEGESADLAGVVAVAFYELEHIGVDHAAAQQLDPAAHLAQAAAFSAAFETGDLDIGDGFSEREERRIETRLHTRAKQ